MMSDTQVYNGHGECFWCKTPLDEGDFCICDGSRIAGLLEERDELTAENERLLNEVQHLENINSNFMDINAAYQLRVATLEQQVEELTAELATCRQAAFENGRDVGERVGAELGY